MVERQGRGGNSSEKDERNETAVSSHRANSLSEFQCWGDYTGGTDAQNEQPGYHTERATRLPAREKRPC